MKAILLILIIMLISGCVSYQLDENNPEKTEEPMDQIDAESANLTEKQTEIIQRPENVTPAKENTPETLYDNNTENKTANHIPSTNPLQLVVIPENIPDPINFTEPPAESPEQKDFDIFDFLDLEINETDFGDIEDELGILV